MIRLIVQSVKFQKLIIQVDFEMLIKVVFLLHIGRCYVNSSKKIAVLEPQTSEQVTFFTEKYEGKKITISSFHVLIDFKGFAVQLV